MNSKLLVFLLLIVVLALAGYICLQHYASKPPVARSSSPDTPVALTPKTVAGPSSESAQPPPVLFKEATKAAPAPHAPVVAVTEFVVASDDAQLLKMSQEIRQVLEQKLGDQGLTLVDRSKLQDALRGAKLTMAGIADSDSAKQLGKVLNADYIVTSRLSELAGTLIVTCKAIDTETSQIISVGADAALEAGQCRWQSCARACVRCEPPGDVAIHRAPARNAEEIPRPPLSAQRPACVARPSRQISLKISLLDTCENGTSFVT